MFDCWTVDRRHGSAFDNSKCHVTAFRPISKAAHSWSYDKNQCSWKTKYMIRVSCSKNEWESRTVAETTICKTHWFQLCPCRSFRIDRANQKKLLCTILVHHKNLVGHHRTEVLTVVKWSRNLNSLAWCRYSSGMMKAVARKRLASA